MTTSNAAGPNTSKEFPVVIIGSGFGGIGAGIQLKKAGIHSFTIFERADEVGGTWRDNTYPGAACDVPSHVYSFSFEQNPDWSHRYSPSAEIQRYLVRCSNKYDLRAHIRFRTAIVSAAFDETTGRWTLTTDSGETVEARAVISAVGGLVDPAYPNIKGLENFRGELFHTARWNHDYDLTGKRVGVIGTGASAVQVVPSIAPIVEQLHVFQRSPAWVVPRKDEEIGDSTRRLFRRHPLALRAVRAGLYLVSELMGPLIILDSPWLAKWPERMSLRHLEAQVRDPELRRKLTPEFQFGCKRMLVSDDYWAAFNRDNVELVTDAIDEIREHGVLTKDGTERPLDALVLATGFALGLANAPFEVKGLAGLTLQEAWKDGAEAYKGLSVSGFPNWFILMGPNTGPGHTSVLVYTEAQIQCAVQAIKKLKNEGIKYLTVKKSVQDEYNRGVQARMKHTVWASGCSSWYLNPNGENRSLFPGLAAEYNLRTRNFKPSEYDIIRN